MACKRCKCASQATKRTKNSNRNNFYNYDCAVHSAAHEFINRMSPPASKGYMVSCMVRGTSINNINLLRIQVIELRV
jgi:hypothetical protein